MKFLAVLLLWCVNAHAQSVARPQIEIRSGSAYQSEALRAIQNDPAQNPGMLWVDTGQAQFERDCSTCHAMSSVQNFALKFPRAIDDGSSAENLDDAINRCTTTRLKRAPHAAESPSVLSLSAFLHHAAHGKRRDLPAHESAAWRQGRAIWFARQGPQDLSCAMCHDDAAGKRLRTQTISQGHVNGYPSYRMEWQTLGSAERRIRACLYGMEATVLPVGDRQLRALELFVATRGTPLPIETPAVRR